MMYNGPFGLPCFPFNSALYSCAKLAIHVPGPDEQRTLLWYSGEVWARNKWLGLVKKNGRTLVTLMHKSPTVQFRK